MTANGNKKQLCAKGILRAVLISVGCSVVALGLWYVALLTSHSAAHALGIILRQAFWVLPAAMVLSLPVWLSLQIRQQPPREE